MKKQIQLCFILLLHIFTTINCIHRIVDFNERYKVEVTRKEHHQDPELRRLYIDSVNRIDETTLDQVLEKVKYALIYYHNEIDGQRELFLRKVYPMLNKMRNDVFVGYILKTKTNEYGFQKIQYKGQEKLVLHQRGKRQFYYGDYDIKEFMEWATSYMRNDVQQLKNQREFTQFMGTQNRTKLIAVYNEDMKEEVELLNKMQKYHGFSDIGNYLVSYTTNKDIVNLLREIKQPALYLIRQQFFQFDDEDPVTEFQGNFTDPNEILRFCAENSFPILTEYKDEFHYQLVTNQDDNYGTLFAIVDRNADNEQFLRTLFISAVNNRLKQKKQQQIFFAVKYLDSDYYQKILDFDYKIEEYPKIFMIRQEIFSTKLEYYTYNKDEYDPEFIEDYLYDFRNEDLERFYRSQPAIEYDQSNFLIKEIKGTDYWPIIYSNDKEQMVLHYRWTSEKQKKKSKVALKLYHLMCNRFALENSRLEFYIMQMTDNDAEFLKFDSNPDVKIFVPKEKKRPKVLAGDFKFKTFLAFVEEYLNYKFRLTPEERDFFFTVGLEEGDAEDFDITKYQTKEYPENLLKSLTQQLDLMEIKEQERKKRLQEQRERQQAEKKVLEELQNSEIDQSAEQINLDENYKSDQENQNQVNNNKDDDDDEYSFANADIDDQNEF